MTTEQNGNDPQESKATIRIVTMRVDSARLLIDNENKWVEIGKGIVFHVSFFRSATNHGLERAARKLLRFALMSKGQWGDDSHAPESILKLCGENVKVDILIVPQANLIGQPSSSGNTLRYTEQLDKDKAREFYNHFCEEIDKASIEALGSKEKTGAEVNTERLAKEARNAQDPYLTFQTGDFAGKYKTYDDRGVPTHDASGETLSKAARKKCEKIYKARFEKYKKAMEKKETRQASDSNNKNECMAEAVSKKNTKEEDSPLALPESDQSCLPNIVRGVFGNRQGFECVSSGPTIHCLDL